MPTFGSLFAGIGGIDLGLERAGWTCRWQVEWDEWCQRVLAKHWPDIPRYGDITAVDWSGVERVDLLAGGFPCQPFSLAGKRQGKSDDRWLWPAFADAIRALRPGYVLVENVPGLLAGHGGMGAVLGDLADLGYDARWDSIPAAAVGAPHLRYRVWIVAHSQSDGQPFGGTRHSGCHADPSGRVVLWPEPSRDGPDHGTLANADRPRLEGRQVQPECAGEWSAGTCGLADADGDLKHRRRVDVEMGRRWESGEALAPYDAGRSQWRTEPDVGRVAHGVPSRVDRLRGLGNAVVPQVVEVIGRQLLASLEAVA